MWPYFAPKPLRGGASKGWKVKMCEGGPTSSRDCGTWPPRIGPLTQPPTFAVSPLGTENRVLAHPRNCPRPFELVIP